MFTPDLGVNDVHKRARRPSSRVAIFTVSTTSTTSCGAAGRFVLPPAAPKLPRRVHVNDSNRRRWRGLVACGEHGRRYDHPPRSRQNTFLELPLGHSEAEVRRPAVLGSLLLLVCDHEPLDRPTPAPAGGTPDADVAGERLPSRRRLAPRRRRLALGRRSARPMWAGPRQMRSCRPVIEASRYTTRVLRSN